MPSSPDLVLENGKLFLESKFVEANIAVSEGKIAEIKKLSLTADEKINCSGKIIFPAGIDCHVHFRVPGAEQKEDWKTGSRAALHGGIATVLDMPNNNPVIVSVKELNKKRKIVEKDSLVNYGLFFGAADVKEMKLAKKIPGFKLYMGSSTGALAIESPALLKQIFETAFQKKRTLAVHAEDENVIRENISRFSQQNSVALHSQVRSIQAELSAVKTALQLQASAKNRLHICHVSSAKSLQEIINAKKFSKNFYQNVGVGYEKSSEKISCEVSPNYLFFSEKDVREKGNLLKVNPSIKTEADMKALWQGLNSGAIDLIASDHAPHLFEEKQADYWHAPSGIPGIETMFPLMLDACNKGLLALEKLPMLFSENPARIFGMTGKGFLKKGFDADMIVIDLKKEHKIKSEDLFTKCKWSPFDGKELQGFVEKTIVNGNLLFDSGDIVSRIKGKEVVFNE